MGILTIKYLNIFIFMYFSLFYVYCKNIRNQAYRSLVGLRLGMSVSNVSPIRHACWSLIWHVSLSPVISVFNGLSTRHVGLQWGMSVSDESPMKNVEVSVGSTIRHVAGLR